MNVYALADYMARRPEGSARIRRDYLPGYERAAEMVSWKNENLRRNLQIVALRGDRRTLRQIGEDVGLSAERVRQIIAELQRVCRRADRARA